MRTLFRARVFSRAVTSPTDSDDTADMTYRMIVCDLLKIAEHYPQVDEKTDALTIELLAARTK
jgi:hypothetical protein